MKNLYLAQVNDVFGKQKYAQLPLAVAMLWAYAKKDPLINKNYQLSSIIYGKYPLDQIIDSIKNPSILGLSSYMWNWNFNLALAELVKNKYPECLIVIGGPHVPEHDTLFFQKHPFIDILVHREGELTFHDILLRHQANKDYEGVLGTSINKGGFCVHQGARERIQDLMILPSPYLEGIYDDLIAQEKDVIFSGTMEHSRGCPYHCSFCNIGQDFYNKIRKFTLERTFNEIDWMSEHKIDYISNADSNFGILPTDLDIAKYLVKKKQETGFPTKFRTDWAKNKSDAILDIVKLLENNNMNKGITVAIQSMDRNVLDIIKRKNISELEQAKLLQLYEKEHIKTYSELILGLPEETYEGFIKGFGKLIDEGQQNCIDVYPCMVLPNSEYADPAYQEKYGIKTWTSPQANFFVPASTEGNIVNEHEECIYETKPLSHAEWERAYMFSIMGRWGHFLGFTHILSRFVRKHNNIEYHTFYEDLLDWSLNKSETILGTAVNDALTAVRNTCENNGFRGISIHDIFWDFDQAIALKVISHKQKLYNELYDFMFMYIQDKELLDELLLFQQLYTIDHETTYPVYKSFKHNILYYITTGKNIILTESRIRFDARKPSYNGNIDSFSRDLLWFYRRVGGCRAYVQECDLATKDIIQ